MAAQYRVGAAALSLRLKNGETAPEAAVNALLPVIIHKRPFKTVKSKDDYYKISCATLRHRVKNLKMSYMDAISMPVKVLDIGPAGYRSTQATRKKSQCGDDPKSS